MGCQSEVEIGSNLTFSICCHDPDTGVLTDADAAPEYRVYEDETAAPILTGTMTVLDDVNTVGFYTELIACTAGNGFEANKSYTIYITATVDSDTGGICYGFRAVAISEIADAVWDEAQADHVGAGTFGEIATETAAILVDTDVTIPGLIIAASPISHTAASSTDTTGTIVSGTYANTATDDDVYWQIAPVTPAVGGFGLNVQLNFNIGVGRVPDSVLINGRYYAAPAAGTRGVDVKAYNYLTASYDTISNSTTRFDNSTVDENFQYALLPEHRQSATGNVVIRFTSTSTNVNDDFYCDRVNLSSVALAAAGLTADAIQQAVWGRSHTGHDEETLGYNLSKTHLLQGQIVSATSGLQFIIDAGVATNDAYNGMNITLEDKTDDHYETRVIVDYIGATNEIFVDRAFSFVPVVGDDYYILNGTGMDSSVITGIADVQSRIPAALVGGAISADVFSISGSIAAADKLEASAETIVLGTVSHDNTVATTTVFYSDDITEATADHFNGRVVIFTSGDLIKQATDITGYVLDAGEGKFTVTALTELPADNVTFIIV